MSKELTSELINEFLYYKDGTLYRKKNVHSSLIKDNVAGYKRKDGYVLISLKNKTYLAHRIVFLMHHGRLPKYIDHIDRNPSNNCIENLRECNMSQNGLNVSRVRGVSRYKGVSWDKTRGKWVAKIRKDYKRVFLGRYENEVDAANAYNVAAKTMFGEFAELNRGRL